MDLPQRKTVGATSILSSMATTSTKVLLGGGGSNSTSAGQKSVAGVHFGEITDIVKLKDTNCSGTKGSRRIQINQLGVAPALTAVIAGSQSQSLTSIEVGSMAKKRWSFHGQINELVVKKDKSLKPIHSPNKRRKSGGPAFGLSQTISDTISSIPFFRSLSEDCHNTPQEQVRSSRQRHSLPVAINQQSHSSRTHHNRHINSGRIIPIREPNIYVSSSKRRQHTPDCLSDPRVEYESSSATYKHFRFRKPKPRTREAPPPPDYLSTMPDEILLRVFKYLPKAALANLGRTSRRYLQVIQDESLWKRLCVMGKTMLPEHLMIVMTRKPTYLRMARTWISDPEEIPEEHQLQEFAEASQLLYLDLSAACISPETLALLLRASPKLIKLSLEHLTLSKEVLNAMMGIVETVEVLNLTLCYDVDATLLKQFLLKCKRLTELNLGCMKVDWGHEDLASVINSVPATVVQLNISGYRSLLDNSHVALIVNRCPNLIELDISDSQEIQSKTVDYMLRLTKLVHLGLSRCYGIDPPVYTMFANHASLKYLDLFSLFKESSLRHLSSNLPKIEINKFPFSAIARPTVGNKRSSIWLQRVRD